MEKGVSVDSCGDIFLLTFACGNHDGRTRPSRAIDPGQFAESENPSAQSSPPVSVAHCPENFPNGIENVPCGGGVFLEHLGLFRPFLRGGTSVLLAVAGILIDGISSSESSSNGSSDSSSGIGNPSTPSRSCYDQATAQTVNMENLKQNIFHVRALVWGVFQQPSQTTNTHKFRED